MFVNHKLLSRVTNDRNDACEHKAVCEFRLIGFEEGFALVSDGYCLDCDVRLFHG